MVTSAQTVTIERHAWENGVVALTFTNPETSDTTALPLVFVLHGLGSRKERHLDLCLRLAKVGFRACAVDARLHGDRQTAETAALWGERQSLAFLQTFSQVVLGTVEELRQIADEWGAARYGVVGHSMGGYIALIAALSDQRAQAIVNVGGSLDSQLSPALAAQLPPAIRDFARQLDPVARAAEFWPTPVLLLHGVEDATVPVAGARRLHDALTPFYTSAPERLGLTEFVGVGHEMTTEAADRAVAFLGKHLLP